MAVPAVVIGHAVNSAAPALPPRDRSDRPSHRGERAPGDSWGHHPHQAVARDGYSIRGNLSDQPAAPDAWTPARTARQHLRDPLLHQRGCHPLLRTRLPWRVSSTPPARSSANQPAGTELRVRQCGWPRASEPSSSSRWARQPVRAVPHPGPPASCASTHPTRRCRCAYRSPLLPAPSRSVASRLPTEPTSIQRFSALGVGHEQ